MTIAAFSVCQDGPRAVSEIAALHLEVFQGCPLRLVTAGLARFRGALTGPGAVITVGGKSIIHPSDDQQLFFPIARHT